MHSLRREESDGSPEKQEIDNYESDNHANHAPDQHVTNIVPDHALSRFRCGLDDLFAMPFRHQTLAFLWMCRRSVLVQD